MSAADMEAYIESVRENHERYSVGQVLVFVDYREDNRRRIANKGTSATEMTLMQALESVHVRDSVGVPIRCTLKAGDAIVARLVAATAKGAQEDGDAQEEGAKEDGDAQKEGDAHEARRRAIVENISIEGASLFDLLPADIDVDCIMVYERKTLADLISSTKARGAAGREQHFDEQIGRMLVFSQATGAQPRLVLEGYAQNELTGDRTGVQVIDHAHTALTEVACLDGIAPWHSDSTVGTARLLLKDARCVARLKLASIGWTRMGTGETRAATVKMAIAKKDNYDVTTWFRGALISIPSMSEARASAIMEHYPTMLELVDAYRASASDEERLAMISDIPCNGKPLNYAVSQSVAERFYQSLKHVKKPRKPTVRKKKVAASGESDALAEAPRVPGPAKQIKKRKRKQEEEEEEEEVAAAAAPAMALKERPPRRRAAEKFDEALARKEVREEIEDVDTSSDDELFDADDDSSSEDGRLRPGEMDEAHVGDE